MFFHFLDTLTLVDVPNVLGFCVKGTSVRCNVDSRQYLNILVKMRIMEGFLNCCINRIITM